MIHLLFRDVDYEGSDVIAVFESKDSADFWLAWCNEHQRELMCGDRNVEPRLTWDRMKFRAFPGDGYHVESWEVRPRTYGNVAAVSKVRIEE